MNLQILKQIWYNRRLNGWIVAELIAVVYFMWGIVDPVYVLMSNRAIPDGFNVDKVYVVRLLGNVTSSAFDDGRATNEEVLAAALQNNANATRIMNLVREQCPEVESAAVVMMGEYPTSDVLGIGSDLLQSDTTQEVITVKYMPFYTNDEVFRVFRVHDATTDELLPSDISDESDIYISEDAAKRFFPDATEYVGKVLLSPSELWNKGTITKYYDTLKVAGVFRPMKLNASTTQPVPTAYRIMPKSTLYASIPSVTEIAFRLRGDASAASFEEKFKKEIVPLLPLGEDYKFYGMHNLAKNWADKEVTSGATNKLRLHVGMMAFFLLCVFLAVSGTFWLRAKARRGEIGLRKALGGSRRRILAEFLTESGWLVTLAWLVGIVIVYNRVHVTGFAEAPEFLNDAYPQNRLAPHFWIVSGIVYVLTLSIAFVGTWFPARQAARTDAAEALRGDT